MMTTSRFGSLVSVLAFAGSMLGVAGCEDAAAKAEREKFVKTMEDTATELCGCTTMECLEKANKKMEAAKTPQSNATPEEVKRVDDAAKKIEACTPKVTEAIGKEAEKKAMDEVAKAAAAAPPADAASAAPDASAAPAASAAPDAKPD